MRFADILQENNYIKKIESVTLNIEINKKDFSNHDGLSADDSSAGRENRLCMSCSEKVDNLSYPRRFFVSSLWNASPKGVKLESHWDETGMPLRRDRSKPQS